MEPESSIASCLHFRGNVPCVRCGYDLDGRALESLCPECGSGVRESLSSLALTPELDLRKVRSGVNLVLIASPIGLVVYATLFALSRVADQILQGLFGAVAVAALMSMGPLLAWRGLMRATSVQIGEKSGGRLDALRWGVARLSMFYAAVYGLTLAMIVVDTTAQFRVPDWLSLGAALVAVEVWCWRNFVALTWVGKVAEFGSSPRLARAIPTLRAWVLLNSAVCAWVAFARLGILPQSLLSLMAFNVGAALSLLCWCVAWPVLLVLLSLRLSRLERNRRDAPAKLVGTSDDGARVLSHPA